MILSFFLSSLCRLLTSLRFSGAPIRHVNANAGSAVYM